MIIRESTYTDCLEISSLSRSYFTVDQCMGGSTKISTHAVTIKVPPSPYLRSKMGIALVASPMLSGNRVEAATLLMLLPCSSTSTNKGPFPASITHQQFGARETTGLTLVAKNYVHMMHHLMVSTNASHMQMALIIRSPCKTGRTC